MAKTATLYRMVTDEHLCPSGLKSKHLLERQGYTVDDHHLRSREQTEAFKREHGVDTTPQTFIDGQRIGGHEDLQRFFGKDTRADEDATSYQPVIAVFGVAALMALAATWATTGTVLALRAPIWFVAISMCVLAILKLRDLENEFSQLWTECQNCSGSAIKDVLCSARDCPIFYKRTAVRGELQRAQDDVDKFGW